MKVEEREVSSLSDDEKPKKKKENLKYHQTEETFLSKI